MFVDYCSKGSKNENEERAPKASAEDAGEKYGQLRRVGGRRKLSLEYVSHNPAADNSDAQIAHRAAGQPWKSCPGDVATKSATAQMKEQQAQVHKLWPLMSPCGRRAEAPLRVSRDPSAVLFFINMRFSELRTRERGGTRGSYHSILRLKD